MCVFSVTGIRGVIPLGITIRMETGMEMPIQGDDSLIGI